MRLIETSNSSFYISGVLV